MTADPAADDLEPTPPEEEIADGEAADDEDDEVAGDDPQEAFAVGKRRFDLFVHKQFPEDRRLDQYIVVRLPEQQLSRGDVKKLFDGGLVIVNGKPAKPSQKVRVHDRIVVELPLKMTDEIKPEPMPLNILYEDEFILVLNKPANLIVHPGRGKANWDGTLINGLAYHFGKKLSTVGGADRPGIIHRLDRDTTGVIVCAKDDLAHRNIGLQFEKRHVQKEYLALTYGVVERDCDIIDRPIGHHPSVREKMTIRDDPRHGKEAVTMYEVVERFRGYTLVRCKPKTGRTHQIRVHLGTLKNDVVADKLYTGKDRLYESDLKGEPPAADEPPLISRQALHAHKIRFRHPRCHEWMEIEAPPPDDFQRTLDAMRKWTSLGG
ncbi:MAG: RluA family pseudouridine synthase [Planctomycetia bacterium]